MVCTCGLFCAPMAAHHLLCARYHVPELGKRNCFFQFGQTVQYRNEQTLRRPLNNTRAT